jgi:hypothetical protein
MKQKQGENCVRKENGIKIIVTPGKGNKIRKRRLKRRREKRNKTYR